MESEIVPRFLTEYYRISSWFRPIQVLPLPQGMSPNSANPMSTELDVYENRIQLDFEPLHGGGLVKGDRQFKWHPTLEAKDKGTVDQQIIRLNQLHTWLNLDVAYVWEDYVVKQRRFYLMPNDDARKEGYR